MDFFEDHGFKVFEAGTADEAIAILFDQQTVQTVLTDLQMPGSIDGSASRTTSMIAIPQRC